MNEVIREFLKEDFKFFPVYSKQLFNGIQFPGSIGFSYMPKQIADGINVYADNRYAECLGKSLEFCFNFTPSSQITDVTLDEINFEMMLKAQRQSSPSVCIFLDHSKCEVMYDNFDYANKMLWCLPERDFPDSLYEIYLDGHSRVRVTKRGILHKFLIN